MKKLAFLGLLFASSSAFGQAAISLAPTESYLKGLPGTTVSQEFVVVNDGAVSYLLSCSFNDLWFDGENTVSGELGTQKERQAGYQLQCSPNRVLIPPKYVQKIKVVGLIPKDQEGERYTRFFAEMLPPEQMNSDSSQTTHATIGYSGKVGATIGLIAQGTEHPSTEITETRVESTKRFQIIHFKIKNTGNVHLGGSGTVVITNSTDKAIEKVPLVIPFLYPSQTKSISFNLTDPLPKGRYKVLLSVAGTANESNLVKDFPLTVDK